MDKLRRSFRSSFRRKEEACDEGRGERGGPARQWPADEAAVKTNTCSFEVKYLGSVEVFESRGMQVCEEAVKNLKNSKRKPIKGMLHISGDGLRVADSDTKGLVLDQTIEKVSFCAPDRNYERGFSYICRDGTTRRWLCHGFMAGRDTGERLSHAVGCAFAICLEKKQKRDKECAVAMQYDTNDNTFTRFGSFRQGTITDRLRDPQIFRPTELERPASQPTYNPNAIARPQASDLMYLRQASFRGLGQLSGSTPFKRQHSLRLSELPSTLARRERDCGPGQFSPISEDVPAVSPGPASLPALPRPSASPLPTPLPAPLPASLPAALPAPMPTPLPAPLEPASPNPWDLVPDQPLHSRAAPATRPTSLQAYLTSPDHTDWTRELANLHILQPEKPTLATGAARQSHKFEQSAVNAQIANKPNEDPFDAEWVSLALRNEEKTESKITNPFTSDVVKAFELKM